MRVTVLDYGVGNLHSLCKALALAGQDVVIETDPLRCLDSGMLVLPGVGAFGPAAARLAPARDALRAGMAGGQPVLGVCLGMQLLFDASDEAPGQGLGVFPGRVTRLRARRVPHIGWNPLEEVHDDRLTQAGLLVPWFANSYACRPRSNAAVSAWCTHEADRFPAALRAGRVTGVQFHPEKSGEAGVAFLAELVREAACS